MGGGTGRLYAKPDQVLSALWSGHFGFDGISERESAIVPKDSERGNLVIGFGLGGGDDFPPPFQAQWGALQTGLRGEAIPRPARLDEAP